LVPFNASINLAAQFFVDIKLVFKFGDQVAIKLKPNIFLDLFPVHQTILLYVNIVGSDFNFRLLVLC
jgi:hypothetical protein